MSPLTLIYDIKSFMKKKMPFINKYSKMSLGGKIGHESKRNFILGEWTQIDQMDQVNYNVQIAYKTL